MGSTIIPTITRSTRPLILDVEKLRRANALPTTATTYKTGDLLTLSNGNVLTHAADASTWDVICGQDITAAQATQMAADGVELPIYYGGVFSVEAVSISGTLLLENQYSAARAKATKNKIELSKV
ncbi:hypothetical protein F949_01640 [Acinetobacter junii NIPH 182]|uniref:hypothetical protein n=1 Tax=Acinetobacter junii TaxID=40215 RepID=UPI0002CE7050|nr:hypothetical protein [Acinetobacter junii]ENV64251.1 hypothetical protein F949_01640 [Acinetobacter junii NIPH 182]